MLIELSSCVHMWSLTQPYLLNRLCTALNMNFFFTLSQRYYLFALHRHFPVVFCRQVYVLKPVTLSILVACRLGLLKGKN